MLEADFYGKLLPTSPTRRFAAPSPNACQHNWSSSNVRSYKGCALAVFVGIWGGKG